MTSSEFQGYPLKIRRKSFFRKIHLRVHTNGTLDVLVGKLTSQKIISDFLLKNLEWIKKVQEEHRNLREQYPPKKFIEGELYPYLGNDLPLRIVYGNYKVLKFIFFSDHFLCEIPQKMQPQHSDFKRALRRCYEKAGRNWLLHRLEHWSNIMGLYPKRVTVRSQKTRWGSCSSQGSISLNWRLLAAPLPILDYVIIHELAHLRFQNHSKQFWALVAQFDSHYKYHRKWLRQNVWSFDFLAKKTEL